MKARKPEKAKLFVLYYLFNQFLKYSYSPDFLNHLEISFQDGSFPYINIESAKIFPVAFLKYHVDKINNNKERNTSIKDTSVKTILADRTGDEVRGKKDNIFIANVSGFPRAKNAIATGMTGTIINELLADVFGSLMVAAIAEKKVFQKRKPLTDRINNTTINDGLVIERGIDHPLPNIEETITKIIVLKALVTSKTIDNNEIPKIFPSIHICGLIADTITSVILSCFSPVIATNR